MISCYVLMSAGVKNASQVELTDAKASQLSSDTVYVKEPNLKLQTLENICLPYCTHLVSRLISLHTPQFQHSGATIMSTSLHF
ncbi:hypothetical protein WJX77_003015 [Trebouxia sp. C0004]